MAPKVGDRVSLDAKKVGQPRRVGVVVAATQGLTAVRYEIRWDDGSASVISPSGGTLTVEGKAKKPKAQAEKSKAQVKKGKPKKKK
jgi:hypothetical protein